MDEEKKSLRLIITELCNIECPYCCNKQELVRKHFVEKQLEEVDFTKYKNVCITGGEPLISPLYLKMILDLIPGWQNRLYLYTNGLLISEKTEHLLLPFSGINIGVHDPWQVRSIITKYPKIFNLPVRFMVEKQHREDYCLNIPHCFIKTWEMDDCFNSKHKEEWVLIKH
jgi:hypothetical protein